MLSRMIPRMAISVLAAACFCASMHALPPDVCDHSQAFSPDAVALANERMGYSASVYGAELMIEYFPNVPETGWWDKVKNRLLNAKNPTNRRRFYEDWAKRGVQANQNRIYILVCKEPRPLQVEIGVGRELRQRGLFSDKDAVALRQKVFDLFRDGKNDEALVTSVDSVLATLKSNREARSVPVEPFPWTATLSVVGILTALWIGLSATQRLRQASGTAMPNDGWHIGGNYPTSIYTTAAGNWMRQLRNWPTPANAEHVSPPAALPVEPDHALHQEPLHG